MYSKCFLIADKGMNKKNLIKEDKIGGHVIRTGDLVG
jgi:hypothetical protein